MKISRYFQDFIETNGYLELPAIGRFELIKVSNETQDKSKAYAKTLTFTSNPKTGLDDALVSFLENKSRSETYIIHSDIKSFSHYLNELIMQGHEAEIPGIGFLSTNNNTISYTRNPAYIHTIGRKLKKSFAASFFGL